MALTNVLSELRYLLKDTTTGAYRWSDTELNLYIAQGKKDIIRRRPDAHADASGGSIACSITGDPNEQWEQSLLDYCLWRALSKDAEGGDVSQATTHQQAYLESVK